MDVECTTKEIVGKLLLSADELSKRVITAFDPFASRNTINVKALSKFNLDMLEPCAEYLNVSLADNANNKLFTKDTLITRILLALNALLPKTCSQCLEKYAVEFESEEEPCFVCHMCFQGSHNCEATKARFAALLNIQPPQLAGSIWLCHECLATSNPVKPRKSRSRHDRTATESEQTNGDNLNNPTNGDEIAVNQVSIETCSEYKKGKCPHGMRGTKVIEGKRCAFSHPKRCTRYCRNGSKGKNSCQKGVECEFYHPTICRYSVKKRLCTNKKCTYVHLAGTARKEDTNQNKFTPPQAKRNGGTTTKPSNPNKKDDDQEKQSQLDPFLELKGLIQLIQEKFQEEISLLKASLFQQRIPAYSTPPWVVQTQYPLLTQPQTKSHPLGRVTLPSSY